MEMDLKVGDKAIIVNSEHHSEYNFLKCTVEGIKGDKIFVVVSGETYRSEFWLKRNELIPLTYENYEDCIKYGVDLKRMVELFNEYRGNYDCLCEIAEVSNTDCNKKDDEIKSLKKQNGKLMDENAKLEEQLKHQQYKLKQISELREVEELWIAVDVLSCRLAEYQKER